MRVSEAPGAEDAECGRIGPCKKFRGNGGSCGSAQVGEVVGRDGEARHGSFWIKQEIPRVDATVAGYDPIAIANYNEFHP